MNPYEVLGVSPDADEETIKKAYRELVKKYHPDKYVNNPLADVAAKRMKEINQAYDMITGRHQTTTSSPSGSGANYTGSPTFQAVRAYMAQARYREAMAMLENLPRNAEWYFLSGCIRINVGWYSQGISFLETAVQMDPENTEYRETLNNIKSRNTSYQSTRTSHYEYSGCGANMCTFCTLLSCSRCCCIC